MSINRHHSSGVTLIELSIVLVILGILMQAAITPLAGARELQRNRTVASELDTIKQSLISHLLLYGSLPCPLQVQSANSANHECSATSGLLSAVSLGVDGTVNDADALLDPWGRPYRYAISEGTPVWTATHDFLQAPIDEWRSELALCKRAQASGCSRRYLRADNIAFVVYSLGSDPEATGDQAENLDGDATFSVRSDSIQVADKYDDRVVWATQSELLYWLLRAGVMI